MRQTFLDTSYLIALFDHRDSLFSRAVALGRELAEEQVRYVTTYLVIAEFLAHFSRARRDLREGAGNYIAEMVARSDVRLVELTPALLTRGLDFYIARPDKRYSLADCISMEVCKDLGITEVLTSDTDFEHEGFTILLKA